MQMRTVLGKKETSTKADEEKSKVKGENKKVRIVQRGENETYEVAKKMKGENEGLRWKMKGTRAKENKRVQIVIGEKCVRRKSIVKRENKGLRGEINGTKLKMRKKVKVENKRCRSC